MAAPSLHCCSQALSSCRAWAPHCQGLSCGARALGHGLGSCGSHRLCCSAVGGIFLDQGSNPCPLHWQQIPPPTGPAGKSQNMARSCGCVVASPPVPRLWAGLPEAGKVGVCSFNPFAVGSPSEKPWGLTAPLSPQPRQGPRQQRLPLTRPGICGPCRVRE